MVVERLAALADAVKAVEAVATAEDPGSGRRILEVAHDFGLQGLALCGHTQLENSLAQHQQFPAANRGGIRQRLTALRATCALREARSNGGRSVEDRLYLFRRGSRHRC